VTTWIAERNYCVDAVGIDLSLAVLKASEHYKKNPFLHFAQASLFKLPIKERLFDLVYTHGVLHHTYSTREAMKAVATCCTPGGLTYVWVYGKHGLTDSWDRRLGYFSEKHLRPFLSRAPAWVAAATLIPVAFGYIFLNSFFRVSNPKLQGYNFRRALHAARDRFTPLFAHRHSYEEVEGWFKDFGYEDVEMLDWRLVPAVARALFRGAVAVRGRKKKDGLENQRRVLNNCDSEMR
jgi:SAM-dependent methyltransferase